VEQGGVGILSVQNVNDLISEWKGVRTRRNSEVRMFTPEKTGSDYRWMSTEKRLVQWRALTHRDRRRSTLCYASAGRYTEARWSSAKSVWRL